MYSCPCMFLCVVVRVCACLKAAPVVVVSWGIEINECNQKQTASQARAINRSKASRAAGLLGQARFEPKRWRIKMQPQASSTALPQRSRCPRREGTGSLARTRIRQSGHSVNAAQYKLTTSWQRWDNTIFSVQFKSQGKALTGGPCTTFEKGHRGATMCERERNRGTWRDKQRETGRGGGGIVCKLNSSTFQCEGRFFSVTSVFPPCLSDWDVLACMRSVKHTYLLWV